MRVKRLILFAGPSCSGKTTFFRQLAREGASPLREELGLGDVSEWTYLNRRKLTLATEPCLERVILHYDLSARFLGRQLTDDSLVRLFEAADELVVITFWARPEVLAQRIEGKRRLWRTRLLWPRLLRRALWKRQKFRDLDQIYSQPSRLTSCYDEWIAFSSAFPAKAHWIVDTSAQPLELHPVTHWTTLRASAAAQRLEAQGVRD